MLAGNVRARIAPLSMRPPSSLPLVFWVQIFVGLASFLIGAWVWSLRYSDVSARLLAAGGASILVSSFAAAAYGARELAIDGAWFRVLSALNHLGTVGFGVAMAALFLVYPRRLVRLRWLLVLPAVFGAVWMMDLLRLGFSGPAENRYPPVVLLLAAILALAGLQYVKAGGDPRQRAALGCFGLSIAIGVGAFVLTIVLPVLIGVRPTLSQGYAFLFMLLVYAGVALGVARYRLFELETWAFRILFYLGGVILLILLDALLISAVAFERAPAFGLSLIVVALFYLPLRDMLARGLDVRRDVDREALFEDVVDVALARPDSDQDARWRSVLQRAFAPLHMETGTSVPAPVIMEDGLALAIPGIAGLAPVRLNHAHGGRRLFSPRDAALAAELSALLRHSLASRTAYEKGAAEERARIALDMHDNIGAQLLSALHSPEQERKDLLIRETLSDLRDIINNASRDGQSLDETLAALRLETAERLAAAGLALEWKADGDDRRTLAPNVVHALRSILRETVSNTIRHAQGSRMEIAVACRDGRLALTVADDGRGLTNGRASGGNGLDNIRTRVEALGGALAIGGAVRGLSLSVEFPCKGGEQA